MALTAAEMVSVKRHLGYHSVPDSNCPWLDTFRALSQVLESLVAPADEECRAILAHLSDIETRLSGGALDRLKAARVGEIALNVTEVRQLRAELHRWRRELSVLVGVPPTRQCGQIVVV